MFVAISSVNRFQNCLQKEQILRTVVANYTAGTCPKVTIQLKYFVQYSCVCSIRVIE